MRTRTALLIAMIPAVASTGVLFACSDEPSESPGAADAATAPDTSRVVEEDAGTARVDASADGAALARVRSPLVAFADFTCLRTASSTRCWGSGQAGQRGDGTDPTANGAPSVVEGGVFDEISAGVNHVCGRNGAGVSCWGGNTYAQLGHPPEEELDAGSLCVGSSPCRKAPLPVPAASGAVSVGAGFLFSCAIGAGGGVSCWGLDTFGELGVPDAGATCNGGFPCGPVTPVPGVTGAIQLALGSDLACALHGDGTVSCWGANYAGTLGRATSDAGPDAAPVDLDGHPPAKVPGVSDAVALAVGAGGHACVIHANKKVSCWGRGGFGQTGHAPSEDLPCPYGNLCTTTVRSVPGLEDVREIALGSVHSCAIDGAGAVRCWGNDFFGQLGHAPGVDVQGPIPYLPTPTVVPDLPPAAHIALGYSHSCALLTDGSVRCWGRGAFEQLGTGTDAGTSYVPVTILGL